MIGRVVSIGSAVALAVLACSCPKPPACPTAPVDEIPAPLDPPPDPFHPPDVPPTDEDGGVVTFDEPFDAPSGYASQPCADACKTLLRLKCPEGRGRPGEDTCYVVCRRAEATGGRIDFKPRCIAAAKDKAALLRCGTYRCK